MKHTRMRMRPQHCASTTTYRRIAKTRIKCEQGGSSRSPPGGFRRDGEPRLFKLWRSFQCASHVTGSTGVFPWPELTRRCRSHAWWETAEQGRTTYSSLTLQNYNLYTHFKENSYNAAFLLLNAKDQCVAYKVGVLMWCNFEEVYNASYIFHFLVC